jgi:hypothetical protein
MNTTRIKQFAAGVSAAAITFPALALAQFTPGVTNAAITGGSGLSDSTFGQLIQRVINWGLYIIGGLGILGFIYAGFLYITAGGEEEKIDGAKKMMTYAIIGIVVALIGLIAMNTIDNLIGGAAVESGGGTAF